MSKESEMLLAILAATWVFFLSLFFQIELIRTGVAASLQLRGNYQQ